MSALEDAADIDFSAFKDPKLARGLIETIHRLAPEHATLMEVCGTHTVAIARNGIRDLMPEGLRLASGPGCPVCVTCNRDIDTVIALARIPNVTITTFGDMTRVPGSTSSLLAEQAAGRSVEIVYSPLDALAFAKAHLEREVVFVGVGFETTTPLVAMAIKRARAMGLSNFTVFAAHKNMPGALELLVGDPTLELDALILPGHVSTIIGAEPYRFLAEKYGGDVTAARIAALLHDCTKKLDLPQQLSLCRHYGLPLDEMERTYLKLLHSKTGAAVARDKFGVTDEIYNAIYYHTTGKADMTLLEKIIYLADYIEPSRSFPGVEELRAAVHEDLDRGLCQALADSIRELQGYGSPVHPNTREALSYIQREIGGTIE